MPEGDTLRRAARALRPVLENHVVTSLWFHKLRGHRPRVGDRIVRVEAVGKYLLIEFDRRLVLQTHLGMAGSWRVSPLDVPVPRTPRLRVVIETDAGRALCFAAPSISTHVVGSGTAAVDLVGPDLSNDGVDIAAIVQRSRQLAAAQTTLAESLLDQKVAAGVGNVFKSETLFVAGVFPFDTVARVADDTLERVWNVAHRQLLANRTLPHRVTTSPGDQDRKSVV